MEQVFDGLIPLRRRLARRRLWSDKDKTEHDENEQGDQDERAATAAPAINWLIVHGEILSSQPGSTVIQCTSGSGNRCTKRESGKRRKLWPDSRQLVGIDALPSFAT